MATLEADKNPTEGDMHDDLQNDGSTQFSQWPTSTQINDTSVMGGGHDTPYTLSGPNDDNDDFKIVQNRKRHRVSSSDTSTFDNVSAQDYKNLSVDDKLSVMFSRVNDIGQKVDQCLALESKVQNIESKLSDQLKRITLLEYKSLDQEARSRRNNLIFGGIPESVNENCQVEISNFLRSELGIDQCPTISRIHRLGRFQRGKCRPIIAYFLDYRDTELVIRNAYKLRNSSFSINRDFPREIANARKSLWPELKQLKREFPTSKVNLVYPAKIIKDGKVHADMFPHWSLVLQGDRVKPTRMPFTTTQGRREQSSPERIDSLPASQHSRNVNKADSRGPGRYSRSASASARGYRRRTSKSPVNGRRPRGFAPDRRDSPRNHTNSNTVGLDSGIRRPWDSGAGTQSTVNPQEAEGAR